MVNGWCQPIAVSGSGNYRLRYWRFEGSNDGATWTVLKDHTNDTSSFPGHAFSVAAWPIDLPPATGSAGAGIHGRWIIRVPTHSDHPDRKELQRQRKLTCAGIELYYGMLIE
jgi:hypothetical protein